MRYKVTVKVVVFAYEYPVVPALFIEKTVLSPLNCLCTFVKNQLSMYIYMGLFSNFCSITQVYLYANITLF